MKKFISFMLITVIALSAVPALADVSAAAEYVYRSAPEPTVSYIGGEWAVMGLARSDADVPDEYYEKYYENVKKYVGEKGGILHDKKYTEYSRVILALTAIGVNPQNVEGYNLLLPLGDYEKTVWQGINGPVWALIALDSGNYAIPQIGGTAVQATREMYLNEILSEQCADGGWSISGNSPSEADITAMALCALSNYTQQDEIRAAADKALEFLSENQNESGGYSSGGIETCESAAQVVTALCALGISPEDNRFVKNGMSAAYSLMTFAEANGGFKHTANDGTANPMSSEQALYALAALKRFNENKAPLYDMSDADVKIKNYEPNKNGLPDKNSAVKKSSFKAYKTFSDIAEHPCKNQIEALASRGIINGKTAELFEPDCEVTRAEFAALVTKSLGIDQTYNKCFEDVTENSWYYGYVSSAYKYKIILGISDNEFNPDGLITKEEAAVMVCRAAKLCGLNAEYGEEAVRDVLSAFADYKTVSPWAEEALAFCYDCKILSAEEINTEPKKNATRAKIALMLYNLLDLAELL